MRVRATVGALALAAAGVILPVAAGATPRQSIGGPELDQAGVAVNLTPGIPAPPVPRASAYLIADLDTGRVLAARSAHRQFAPASCLKILTALTFIPRLDPNGTVKATWGDATADGTRVGIVPDKTYRIRDLFTAMLVMSGNDAADAIATAYGSRRAALTAMNEEAARVQALDTRAETPNGLDHAGQHSSAYDLALLTRAALQLPDFRRYVRTVRAEFGAIHGRHFEIYTHDHILLNYHGAFGVKNGYTVAAQASFVGAARRNGHRLVAVVMHANPYAWEDVMKLLTWGFDVDDVITPVGELVDPLHAPTPVPSSLSATQPSARAASVSLLSHSTPKSSGIPKAPLAVAAIIVVGFIVLRLRAHRGRRRWRYRSRYSLPKS